MSSDLYERMGLLNTLLDVLEEDLATRAPTSEVNSQSGKSGGEVNGWRRYCNTVTIVARIPLEPIPLDHKNAIFGKLVGLDRYLVAMSGKVNGNLEILILVRRALIRFVGVVGKTTVEVWTLNICLMNRIMLSRIHSLGSTHLLINSRLTSYDDSHLNSGRRYAGMTISCTILILVVSQHRHRLE
jgi:hypothetical protein